MDNYDDLKAQNNADEDVVVSIHTPHSEPVAYKQKKPNTVSILISALKAENFKHIDITPRDYVVPTPKYTHIAFLVGVLILMMLLVMQTFIDLLILIPIALITSVLLVPVIVLTFFVELNSRNTIKVLHIVVMSLLGIFSYAFVTSICDNFLIKFIYESYLDTLGRPIAWTVILCFMVFICCNVLKVSKLPECLLISVSFAVGYSVAQSLLDGFESLFIVTDIMITDKQYAYSVPLLINDQIDLLASLNQFKASWFLTFIYKPFMLSSLAVIVGTVVSQREMAKLSKRPMIRSLYLLILLNMMLYFTSVVDTTFFFFNFILKAISLVCAVSLSVKMIDYCLEKEC